MEWDIEITVDDVPPSVNRAYWFTQMKNSKRIIKVKTDKAKKWYDLVFNALCDAYPDIETLVKQGTMKYQDGYLELDIKLYFQDFRRHDVDNFQKLTIDAFTGVLWKDDTQVKKLTVEKYEGTGFRKTEIKIKRFQLEKRDTDLCNFTTNIIDIH